MSSAFILKALADEKLATSKLYSIELSQECEQGALIPDELRSASGGFVPMRGKVEDFLKRNRASFIDRHVSARQFAQLPAHALGVSPILAATARRWITRVARRADERGISRIREPTLTRTIKKPAAAMRSGHHITNGAAGVTSASPLRRSLTHLHRCALLILFVVRTRAIVSCWDWLPARRYSLPRAHIFAWRVQLIAGWNAFAACCSRACLADDFDDTPAQHPRASAARRSEPVPHFSVCRGRRLRRVVRGRISDQGTQSVRPAGISPFILLLTLLTVVTSWTLLHTLFGLRYAHTFYGDSQQSGVHEHAGGLIFPGNRPPDYFDFAYFSFVVGMTFSGVGCANHLAPHAPPDAGPQRSVVWI